MPIRRMRVKFRRMFRQIVHHDDPPERIARGVAAGFFAAAFPLPGFQIPLSLACAFIARGNALVAVFPQFLSNAGTMLPLAYLQFRLGAWLWPAEAVEAETALGGLRQAVELWAWRQPWDSLKGFLAAVGGLGVDALGPLALGVLVSGAVLALVSYPLTVIGVWVWRARRRRRQLARGPTTGTPPGPFVLPETLPSARSGPEVIERHCQTTEGFLYAERLKLLIDGRAAYPEMLSAIAAARNTVELETYILAADRTGERFSAVLCAAAQRGVRVRLLYDDVGSLGLSHAYVAKLQHAGVAVSVYHPLRLSRPTWAVNRRDHRKILVVDRTTAFTGGLNIANDYAAVEEGGAGWRDTHLRLDGPRVGAALSALFEEVWKVAKPLPEPAPAQAHPARDHHAHPALPAEPPGGVAVQILSNRELRRRRRIRRAYLYAINRARYYILIENAYFIPDRGVRRALERAVRRGVKVAIAVAGYNNILLAAMASRAIYAELLASGVRIFEWSGAMLHAKTAVIDDGWAVVGSYNFDHRSLIHNLEAVVVVADPLFARQLRDQTLADLAQCREVTPAEHASRPWRQILLDSAAYQLRYWL